MPTAKPTVTIVNDDPSLTFIGFEVSKQPYKLAFVCNEYADDVGRFVLISSK